MSETFMKFSRPLEYKSSSLVSLLFKKVVVLIEVMHVGKKHFPIYFVQTAGFLFP